MDLEIKKGDTTIDLCKEKDGTITIENSFQDTMDLISVPINLTQEEAKKVIVQLQKYCE
jgi:predicted RNA-binding protein